MSGDLKIKTAAGKPDLALIPLTTLYGVARVFGYGAKKYERDNWKLAADADAPRRYLSAALRHLSAMQGPVGSMATDDESGLPHIDHAICSLVMLRGLLALHHGAAHDPGEGKEPPVAAQPVRVQTHAEVLDGLADNPPPRAGVCQECGYSCCSCYPSKPRFYSTRRDWE